MRRTLSTREQRSQINARLRMIVYYKQVSHKAWETCRVFGISGSQFYFWLYPHRQEPARGLRDQPQAPKLARIQFHPTLPGPLSPVNSLSERRRRLSAMFATQEAAAA